MLENKGDFRISEHDELKLIYFEILAGYCFDAESSLFIRHFSDEESFSILKKREELFYYYSGQGVPHESQLLKNAIEIEEWSTEKEDKILELKYHISDNEKILQTIIKEQRAGIEKIIDGKRAELAELLFERKCILGRSIEDLIDEDVNDFIIYLSFFRDENLKIPVAESYSEFEKWDPIEVNVLNERLNFHYKKFSEEKIKGVACLPMFLNKFSYVKDDVVSFLNKPISKLTHNQSSLFSLGTRNLSTLSQSKGHPPDLNLDAKIDDLVKWYDIQHSICLAKRASGD